MSLIIVNKPLYKDENSIWLNRYMSFDTFEKYFFKPNGINVSFSRIDLFPDGLEGWNPKIENINIGINNMAQYNNRVMASPGASTVSNKCLLQSVIKDSSDGIFDSQLVSDNIDEREKSFASCWFISQKKDQENRVMWKLYANRDEKIGVKIAIKWIDLKLFLENHEDIFYAGYIDYNGNSFDNYMFKKEISYEHENEFRILKKNETKEERLPLYIDFNFLSKIHVCVDNSYENQPILEILKKFEITLEDEKKSYSISKLIPEFKKRKKTSTTS